ncbi:MAG: M23 family peptidase [Alphaproteobacteria bacterium]|nr:M23 family peptidase [Alphaproteobacteria bacterium]
MSIKELVKLNIKQRSRQKIVTIAYAMAVTFAFILSLTNNNVEASVANNERMSYLMVENNVVQNLSNSETVYPEASIENIKNLFSTVNALVQEKEIDKDIVVQKGDTLISVLQGIGLSRAVANDVFAELRKEFDPRNLKIGQKLHVNYTIRSSSGEFVRLNTFVIETGIGERVIAYLNENDEFEVELQKDEMIEEVNNATGIIEGTLGTSMQKQGIPARVVHNFISIFSYSVDFRRDVRRGDKFEIIYENYIDKEGKTIKSGNILYAALILRNDRIALYRFQDKAGKVDYYTEKGQALKKTLDRKPMAFKNARISSPFGRRFHPVLRKYKIHWGVDYAAPRGTAIYAGGDGVVQAAKYYGSYGNYIKIRHNSEFSTAYGHMQGFARGIRPGVRVKQGQLIGYVGSTGRSTGPHLHYEVIQNGRRVNPRTIKASTGENLSGTNLANFKNKIASIKSTYKSMFAQNQPQKVAQK